MRKRLLIFGYPLLEISTAWLLIILLGFGWTLFIYVAAMPFGWLLFKQAGRSAIASAQRQQVPASKLTFHMLAGVLFMIPGVWTDVLALLCLIPLIQNLLAAPFAAMSTYTGNINVRLNNWNQDSQIVEGVVIHENDDPSGSMGREN